MLIISHQLLIQATTRSAFVFHMCNYVLSFKCYLEIVIDAQTPHLYVSVIVNPDTYADNFFLTCNDYSPVIIFLISSMKQFIVACGSMGTALWFDGV